MQRATSVVAGVLVLALAGGIALTRVGSTSPARISTAPTTYATTTTLPSAEPDVLSGVWRPALIAGYAGPLTAPPLLNDPILRIDGNGEWSGSDGCHYLSGSYRRVAADAFRFEHTVTTKQMCTPHTPIQFFEGAVQVAIVNDRLTFLGADQSHLAEFERGKVSARIELPSTTLVSGSSMKSHVVIQNDTGGPVYGEGCGSLFQLVLSNDTVHPSVNWTLCRRRFTIPAGESKYPVTAFVS